MAKEPKIVKKLVEFFQQWEDPENKGGEYKAILPHHLLIHTVSTVFVFKWIVSKEELKDAAQFLGMEIVDNVLYLTIGEYEVELEGRNE